MIYIERNNIHTFLDFVFFLTLYTVNLSENEYVYFPSLLVWNPFGSFANKQADENDSPSSFRFVSFAKKNVQKSVS
jgi:hypothetical protein